MNNKNEFIKKYTQIPGIQVIKKFISGSVIFVNIFNYCAFYFYNDSVSNSIPSSIITLLIAIILIFDLYSLIFYIFPKTALLGQCTRQKQFHLFC